MRIRVLAGRSVILPGSGDLLDEHVLPYIPSKVQSLIKNQECQLTDKHLTA